MTKKKKVKVAFKTVRPDPVPFERMVKVTHFGDNPPPSGFEISTDPLNFTPTPFMKFVKRRKKKRFRFPNIQPFYPAYLTLVGAVTATLPNAWHRLLVAFIGLTGWIFYFDPELKEKKR